MRTEAEHRLYDVPCVIDDERYWRRVYREERMGREWIDLGGEG